MFRYLATVGIIIPLIMGLDKELVVLRAVLGLDARLPCGQGKVFLDGPDSYILWLKNDRDFLYRFPNDDTERRSLSNDNVFGTSCEEGTCHDDTSLLIKHVGEQDGGIYRCRVHYQASQSVDYVIDVRLVESPGMPKIFDKDGEVKGAFLGPLSIGSDLKLVCEVEDEHPDTLMYWSRNGVVIERGHRVRPGVLGAEVNVKNVTRDELDAHYSCLAQNADVTPPLAASVVIHMYLPPISVEIRLNNNLDFEVGQPRVVDCVVVGCVPPPSITWHLGNTLLRSNVHKELHDGNYTVSSMTLVPSMRDANQPLVCRAHNSHLPNAVFEDKVTLNVGYRPFCVNSREQVLGTVEREAETVTCVVEAYPEPLQFSWHFVDSRTLYTSFKKVEGHNSRYSSTLTWSPLGSDIGSLHCRAMNAYGEQRRPCTFLLAPGGQPQPPECVLLRSYPSSVRVQCKKGWDGGRSQSIQLVLVDEGGIILHNVSDRAGNFQLADVEDGRNLTAFVYAFSSRGQSDVRVMHLQTVTPLSASAVTENTSGSWEKYLEVSAGVVVVAVAVAAAGVCYKLRKKVEFVEQNPDLEPRSDGSFHREPDFMRDDRLLGTTNITVNQLASCQNQHSSSPLPSCRVLVGCPVPLQDTCPATQHSFFV